MSWRYKFNEEEKNGTDVTTKSTDLNRQLLFDETKIKVNELNRCVSRLIEVLIKFSNLLGSVKI